MEHLNDSDKHKLARRIILSETNKISKKFIALVCDTFKLLDHQQTGLEALIAIVRTVGQQSLPHAIDEERSGELCAVKSVYGVQSFLIQHRYISFLNYRILEKIVERFAEPDGTLKQKLQNYLADSKCSANAVYLKFLLLLLPT